jgi:hypothetical protein
MHRRVARPYIRINVIKWYSLLRRKTCRENLRKMREKLIVGIILVALIACTGVASAALVVIPEFPASDAGIFPLTGPNNELNSCNDLGLSEYSCTKSDTSSGTCQKLDGFTATFDATDTHDISWGSNFVVDAVIVKDGSNPANMYRYSPGLKSDGGLTVAPQHWDIGDPFPTTPTYGGISHIMFCYNPTIPTPEFPTVALPVGMIIGLLGAVFYIRGTKEN